MRPADRNSFGDGRAWEVFAGFEMVFYLAKDPRVTNRSSADHDAVHLVFFSPSHGLIGAIYIAIAENGNLDSGITFDFTDQTPIRMPFIHLGARAAVYAKCLNAYIL